MANEKVEIVQPFYRDLNWDEWKKYKAMYDLIDNVKSFVFADKLARLGKPMITNIVPTAGVDLEKAKNDFEEDRILFFFNEKFFNELNLQDLLFVFLHELVHCIFGHLWRGPDAIKKMNTGDADKQNLHKIWNFAIDVVTNEWLELMGYFCTPQLKEMLIFANKPGIDFPNFSVHTRCEEVFLHLIKKNEDSLEDCVKQLEEGTTSIDVHGTGDGSGIEVEIDSETAKKIGKKIAGSIKPDAIGRPQRGAPRPNTNNHFEKAASKNRKPTHSWSNNALGEARYFNLLKPKNVDWKKILEKIVKRDNYDPIDDQWMKPNRKLYPFYPQLILPSENETIDGKDAYKTLVSIDASGSITDNMLDSAASIVCALPEIIQYDVISWDTKWYQLEASKFKRKSTQYKLDELPGRGGTDLSCTMHYINDNKGWRVRNKVKPDLIIVITDGEGPMEMVPKEMQPRFVFLLTKRHTKDYIMKACPKGMIVETEIE